MDLEKGARWGRLTGWLDWRIGCVGVDEDDRSWRMLRGNAGPMDDERRAGWDHDESRMAKLDRTRVMMMKRRRRRRRWRRWWSRMRLGG